MGILEQSQYNYYNNPSAFGNYQFTSLENIINQFMIVYTGEDKIIKNIKSLDVPEDMQEIIARNIKKAFGG